MFNVISIFSCPSLSAIASGVNTMAKIAFTALAVVGTIYATGNIGAGLEVGKRLIYV